MRPTGEHPATPSAHTDHAPPRRVECRLARCGTSRWSPVPDPAAPPNRPRRIEFGLAGHRAPGLSGTGRPQSWSASTLQDSTAARIAEVPGASAGTAGTPIERPPS